MAIGPQGARAYFANLALAADLSFNAVLGGCAHQTFSARSSYSKRHGKRWAVVSVAVIDFGAWCFGFGFGHCARAEVREAVILEGIVAAYRAVPAAS